MQTDPKGDLQQATEALLHGDLVVFPTETVYGIGASAWNATACARIFQVKRRPTFNPLIVHIPEFEATREVAADFPEWARTLGTAFWPGPLTLVLPKSARIPLIVTADLPTVGVRVPRHPIALALLRALNAPIAAPSANLFSELSPTRVADAREQLGNQVAVYLEGGPCEVGLESTIVGEIDGKLILLRPGGITREAIEGLVGKLALPTTGKVLSPGMTARHYSPKTPLILSAGTKPPGRVGLLTLQATDEDRAKFARVEVLSATGDLIEAAANLFSALHRLEAQGLNVIVARLVPESGLGVAINDRLRRASHQS